jgi:transporter family-2 protein
MGSPLGVMAGGVVGVQHALNGQVNEYSQQSFTTSWLNFITGTTLLLFLLLGGLVFTMRISLDFRQVLGGCILVA